MNVSFRMRPSSFHFSVPGSGTSAHQWHSITVKAACVLNHLIRLRPGPTCLSALINIPNWCQVPIKMGGCEIQLWPRLSGAVNCPVSIDPLIASVSGIIELFKSPSIRHQLMFLIDSAFCPWLPERNTRIWYRRYPLACIYFQQLWPYKTYNGWT